MTRVDLAQLVAAAQQLPALIGHDIPSQIAKAGPRLALHPVPADFEAFASGHWPADAAPFSP